MCETRSSKLIYLVGKDIQTLNCDFLPTKRIILSYYLYLHLQKKINSRQCLVEVIKKCELIWKKLNKSYGPTRNSTKKLQRIVKVWCNLNKHKNRQGITHKKNEKIFIKSLDETLDISATPKENERQMQLQKQNCSDNGITAETDDYDESSQSGY